MAVTIIVIVVVAGLVAATVYLSSANQTRTATSTTDTPTSSTAQTTTSFVQSQSSSASTTSNVTYATYTSYSPAPDFFFANVSTPYLVVTPHNHTLTIGFSLTSYSYPLSLSFNHSSVMQYSNGTVWVDTSKSCSASHSSSASSAATTGSAAISSLPPSSSAPSAPGNGNTTATPRAEANSSITITGSYQQPCPFPPGDPWKPVNGSVINRDIQINSSNIQVQIQPGSVPSNQTQDVYLIVSVEGLRQGVYAIDIELNVQILNSDAGTAIDDLGYMPLVVES